MKFCIATLTCNNRMTLFEVLKNFVSSTEITDKNKIDWFILFQGCSNEYLHNIDNMIQKDEYKNINFRVCLWEENKGLSKGANRLFKMTDGYDYILWLEDDWILLPTNLKIQMNKYPRSWLITCLELLEKEKNVSTIFLRSYATDAEKQRYGWSRTIPYKTVSKCEPLGYEIKMKKTKPFETDNIIFQEIPEFLFTFNPCIYRRCDYVARGVFPLIDADDANMTDNNWTGDSHSFAKEWGFPEANAMEKIYGLKCYYMENGIFGHYEDWSKILLS